MVNPHKDFCIWLVGYLEGKKELSSFELATLQLKLCGLEYTSKPLEDCIMGPIDWTHIGSPYYVPDQKWNNPIMNYGTTICDCTLIPQFSVAS